MPSRAAVVLPRLACVAAWVIPGNALAHAVFIAPVPQTHVSFHAAGRSVAGRAISSRAGRGTPTVINGQLVFVGGYGVAAGDAGEPGRDSVLDAPVPSDAERYRAATGGALPAQHGMIVLPPTTPRGDVTYVWSSSGGN